MFELYAQVEKDKNYTQKRIEALSYSDYPSRNPFTVILKSEPKLPVFKPKEKPKAKPKAKVYVPKISIGGVMMDPVDPIVVINGEPMTKGKTYKGLTFIGIKNNRAVVKIKGKIYRVKLK